MGDFTIAAGDVMLTIPATLEPESDLRFSGDVSLPSGFIVRAGAVYEFDPEVSTTVHVRANVVVEGTLRMRPARPDVVHQLLFEGVNEAAFVGNRNDQIEPTDVGLWVAHSAGVIDAQGSEKTPWTRAAHALSIGNTSVMVEDASGWRVGDELAFTPTAPISATDWWDRYSTRRISDVSGDVVLLDGGVQNSHPAPVDQNGVAHPCEVLNLTRNVRIAGTPGGRTHIAYMHAETPVEWSNVEIQHVAPGAAGRYGLHMHMMGDASQGSFVHNVVVRNCGNHAFVPHASHGITLDGCIAHDVQSDAYWWDLEENGSIDNATDSCLWRRCVASKVDGGYRVGGFLLGVDTDRGRPMNTIVDCVAVGIKGDGQPDPTGMNSSDAAGYIWPELDEFGGSVWIFHDNVAHNCLHNGFETWQNGGPVHHVDDSVIYNCSTAINHGAYGNDYQYRRAVIFGCMLGVWVHAASGSVTDGQEYQDLDIRVTGARAVNLNSVTGGPVDNRIVQFRRCKFAGYTQQAVRAWGEGGTPADDEFPGKWDFRDTIWAVAGLPRVTLPAGAPAGTIVREFIDGVLVAQHQV